MPELRFQATRRQWVLIAVLGALLVAVLVFNRAADTADMADIALAVRPRAASAASAEFDTTNNGPRLPEFTAEEVAAFNPFARPKNADVPTSKVEATANVAQASLDAQAQRTIELQKALAELRSKGVRFVIGNKDGGAAMLGNQRIRAGQIVNGFRVIKIDQSGVELQPAE